MSPNLGEVSYIRKSVMEFDIKKRVPELGEVVMDLFDAALQPSSRRTYRTGQRAYDRFILSMHNGTYFPFQRRRLGETELNLAFYIAFLLLKPGITKANTILNYTSHRYKVCFQGRRLF